MNKKCQRYLLMQQSGILQLVTRLPKRSLWMMQSFVSAWKQMISFVLTGCVFLRFSHGANMPIPMTLNGHR